MIDLLEAMNRVDNHAINGFAVIVISLALIGCGTILAFVAIIGGRGKNSGK